MDMAHKHAGRYEKYTRGLLIKPSLNVGCGSFKVGDVNADKDPATMPDIMFDAEKFPYPLRGCSFGSVLLHHSLEHFKSPEDVIKHCSELIKPKGRIVIIVPSEKNPNYRMEGHKSFFTKKTLAFAVKKHFSKVKCFGYRGDTKNIPSLWGRIAGLVSPNQYICIGEKA
jgi:SAM-dependent methyltransferase